MLVPLAKRIWLLKPDRPPRYPYSNGMYLEGNQRAVIDFGAGWEAFQAIDTSSIETGFISHSHFDHTHSYVLCSQARFYVGQEERSTYENVEANLHFHGYHLWDKLMGGIPRQRYGQVVPVGGDVPMQPGFISPPLAGVLKEGLEFDLGGVKFTALHLPGHTCGHYGFYFESQGILFSGDIDLAPAGPWYSSASASIGDFIASVKRIKEIDPAVLVTSHRRVQTDNIQEKLDAYIQILFDREETIYNLLKEPHRLDEIAEYRIAFPNRRNTYELFWEKMTIMKHLQHLMDSGRIEECEPGVYCQTR